MFDQLTIIVRLHGQVKTGFNPKVALCQLDVSPVKVSLGDI